VHVVRQHQRFDAPAQAAQAERGHGLPQVEGGGDVAAPLVEAHAHLEPVVTHLPRASCQETEAGGLVVPDVKRVACLSLSFANERTRTDEGAILRLALQAGGIR
jgi:hypothetical protein